MISLKAINEYLEGKPFRPFRIHMASGRTFDVRHPEMLKCDVSTIAVFSFVSDDLKKPNLWDTVSLTMIESISFLDKHDQESKP